MNALLASAFAEAGVSPEDIDLDEFDRLCAGIEFKPEWFLGIALSDEVAEAEAWSLACEAREAIEAARQDPYRVPAEDLPTWGTSFGTESHGWTISPAA